MMRNVKIVKIAAFIGCALVTGIVCGRLILGSLEQSFLSGISVSYVMMRYPAGSFLDIYKAISDQNPSVRAAGYYGAREMGLATPEFLKTRFESETDVMVRKVIAAMLREISPNDYKKLITLHPELGRKDGKRINHPPFIF